MGLQLVLLRTGLKPSLHDTALQLGGDVEQPWLMSKCDIKPEVDKYHYATRGGPSHGHT